MALRGVDDQTLYRRPQIDFWDSIRRGDPTAIAVAAGALRLSQIVATNLQLARTHASRRVLTGHLGTVVVGYRRLVSGLACSLCSGTANLFSTHELMFLADGVIIGGGIVGLLVFILLIVAIVYFIRRM